MHTTFNTIEEAHEDLRAEKMIALVDDEDRENEGDFVRAEYPLLGATLLDRD